jgi:hypothetical protein
MAESVPEQGQIRKRLYGLHLNYTGNTISICSTQLMAIPCSTLVISATEPNHYMHLSLPQYGFMNKINCSGFSSYYNFNQEDLYHSI